MIFNDTLISTLEDWEREIGDLKITELSGLVSLGLLNIGSEDYKKADFQENFLDYLRSRVEYLQAKERVFEEFLIDGLLNVFTGYFNSQINKKQEYIQNNEKLLEQAIKADIGSDFTKSTKEKIEFLKSDEYIISAKKELDVWLQLVAKNFSTDERLKMSRQISLEGHEKFEEQMTEEERESFNNLLRKMK